MLTMRCAIGAELGQGELTYNADRITSELRANTMELIGNVSLTQDESSITAERARVELSDTDDTVWAFEDSVRVRTAEAELLADSVSATIENGELATARAEGTPAAFRQLSGPANGQGQGRASLIEYDVDEGVVKLTGTTEPVWFLYGEDKNEFRTNVLTYNMRTGSVSTGRTRGTIRLNNMPSAPESKPPSPQPAAGEQEDGA